MKYFVKSKLDKMGKETLKNQLYKSFTDAYDPKTCPEFREVLQGEFIEKYNYYVKRFKEFLTFDFKIAVENI